MQDRAGPCRRTGSDNATVMTDDRSSDVLSEAERANARRLIDAINEFNVDATGIRDFRELLTVETDSHGELVAGVYGWSWGGTCWIDALWVREDMRGRRVSGPRQRWRGEKHHPTLRCPMRCRSIRGSGGVAPRQSAGLGGSGPTFQTRSIPSPALFQTP